MEERAGNQQDIKSASSKSALSPPLKKRQTRQRGLSWRTLLAVGAIVLVLLSQVSLLVPRVQRALLYLNWVKLPLNADLSNPAAYGVAPYKARDIRIRTADGEELGAWHVLPQSSYSSATGGAFPPTDPLSDDVYDHALQDRPTVIYFHGNAATRAQGHRVRTLLDLSRGIDTNVLALDYRGFGDSSGSPTERGIEADAEATWKWVIQRARRDGDSEEETAKRVLLMGHSLGTGVVAKLAGRLAERGVYPRALVLIAPFSNLRRLLLTYQIAGIVPLLGPYKVIPGAQEFLLGYLSETWDSDERLAITRSPALLVHAADDTEIPSSNSAELFRRLSFERGFIDAAGAVNQQADTVPGWGTIMQSGGKASARNGSGREAGRVVYFEGIGGGHNGVGGGEGIVDLIRDVAAL